MTMNKIDERTVYSTVRRGRSSASLDVEYKVREPVDSSDVCSLEFFLAERYLLFAERRGTLYRGQVHHKPYPLQRAELLSFSHDLLRSHGLEDFDRTPPLAHYSAGVDVEIFPLFPVSTSPK